jgi:hypothetical protein
MEPQKVALPRAPGRAVWQIDAVPFPRTMMSIVLAGGRRAIVYSSTLTSPPCLGWCASRMRLWELQHWLLEGAQAGRLICVRSPAHHDESVLAQQHTWFALDRLARDLSPGVRFLTAGEIENNEIRSAARELLGKAREELWQEAFTADPHTSSEPTIALNGGMVEVHAVLPPSELECAEVEHQKDKENALTDAYRAAGEQFSFKEICEAYLHALLEWKLGPLASTSKWQAQLEARDHEVAEEEAAGANPLRPGSALLRRQAIVQRGEFIKRLVLELPELRDRDADFFASRELRTMPSLMLHAYLRAGLAVTRGRRARPADAYDVVHLTHGLSRCDLVTADRGMVEMVRARKLLPVDVRLFESSDVDGLIAAVRESLDSA